MPHRCVAFPSPPSAEPTAACRIVTEALSNIPLGCFWGDRHSVDSAELSQKTGGTLQALEPCPIAMASLATVRCLGHEHAKSGRLPKTKGMQEFGNLCALVTCHYAAAFSSPLNDINLT
jgi:hypothetical protein